MEDQTVDGFMDLVVVGKFKFSGKQLNTWRVYFLPNHKRWI